MYDLLYPLFVVLHTLCAIFLIGFIFVDIVFLSQVSEKLGVEFDRQMWYAIKQRVSLVTMSILIILALTGLFLLAKWINTTIENFSFLETMLVTKVILSIFLVIIIGLVLTKKRDLMKILIHITFGLSIAIVICAKIAFYF